MCNMLQYMYVYLHECICPHACVPGCKEDTPVRCGELIVLPLAHVLVIFKPRGLLLADVDLDMLPKAIVHRLHLVGRLIIAPRPIVLDRALIAWLALRSWQRLLA